MRRVLTVEEIAKLTSENEGNEVFKLEYKPSEKSLDLQDR